jgi:3',5'-cyclic AMP phosphodiesterase CpdA
MPPSFLHLSDPHLSSLAQVEPRQLAFKRRLGYISWQRKRQHEHRIEVLNALRRDLGTEAAKLVLVTGDLTHIGLPEEFQQASQWLAQLASEREIALVPGNHDACVQDDWEQTFGLWRQYMCGDESTATATADNRDLYPSLRIRQDCAFIGLSSACPKPPLMASGSLGDAQLKRLRTILENTGKQGLCRVIFMHHCPVVGAEKWRKRLTDAAAFSSLVAEHGAELILHGHGHRAHQHQLPGKSGAVPVIAVPSASALGLHGADRAAYNRYSIERVAKGWTLTTTTHQYDPQTRGFLTDREDCLLIERG